MARHERVAVPVVRDRVAGAGTVAGVGGAVDAVVAGAPGRGVDAVLALSGLTRGVAQLRVLAGARGTVGRVGAVAAGGRVAGIQGARVAVGAGERVRGAGPGGARPSRPGQTVAGRGRAAWEAVGHRFVGAGLIGCAGVGGALVVVVAVGVAEAGRALRVAVGVAVAVVVETVVAAVRYRAGFRGPRVSRARAVVAIVSAARQIHVTVVVLVPVVVTATGHARLARGARVESAVAVDLARQPLGVRDDLESRGARGRATERVDELDIVAAGMGRWDHSVDARVAVALDRGQLHHDRVGAQGRLERVVGLGTVGVVEVDGDLGEEMAADERDRSARGLQHRR